MKKITEIRSRNLRSERNSELVRRMRNGEQLTSFDSQSSWYPPRPIIEKNHDAIRQLYGRTPKAMKPEAIAEGFEAESANFSSSAEDSRLQLAD